MMNSIESEEIQYLVFNLLKSSYLLSVTSMSLIFLSSFCFSFLRFIGRFLLGSLIS